MKKTILFCFLLSICFISYAQKDQSLEIFSDSSYLEVKLFPNPAQQFVLISFSNPESFPHHLYIIDMQGKVVRTYGDIRQDQVQLMLNDLSKGLYFFELRGKKSFYGRLLLE